MRAAVVIDYQNVHLTARDLFIPGRPEHEALIHPMQYAEVAVEERNRRQREGYEAVTLERVFAYRGHPHADYDPQQHARAAAQADQWRRDGVEVVLRDLKYRFQRQGDGRPATDIYGRKIPVDGERPKEKGIDVLCALACVRLALNPCIDVVMLASRDTDLVEALNEVYDMGREGKGVARIETLSWDDKDAAVRFGSLKATRPRRIWNTNLGRRAFEGAVDRRDYR